MYKIKKEALIIKKLRGEEPEKMKPDEAGRAVEKEAQPSVRLTEGSMAEFRPRMDSGRVRQMKILFDPIKGVLWEIMIIAQKSRYI